MRLHCIGYSILVALFAACVSPSYVLGSEFNWPSSPYPYSVVDQDLKDVLHELGRNTGLRIKISDRVTGRVKGKIQHTTARDFFTQLCASYGLEWYYDGFTIYISSSEENQTRIINVAGFRLTDFIHRLRSSAFYDPRFPLQARSGTHQIVLSGPPSYIALVDQLVASLTLSDTRTVLYRGESVSVVKFGAEKENR